MGARMVSPGLALQLVALQLVALPFVPTLHRR